MGSKMVTVVMTELEARSLVVAHVQRRLAFKGYHRWPSAGETYNAYKRGCAKVIEALKA